MIAAETKFLNNIKQLENLNWMVYSTGSRFFGLFKETSDWDFMTDERAKNQLTSLGYMQINDSAYADGTSTLVLGKDNIHIQLYKESDLEIMIAIRNAIKSNHYMYHLYLKLNKDDRKMFWKGLLFQQKKSQGIDD